MSKPEYRAQMDGQADASLPTIVYIASASRSGSTVLDQVLSGVDGIVGVGELRRISDYASQNMDAIKDPINRRGCTCGSAISECEFWTAVEKVSGVELRGTGLTSRLSSANRALFRAMFMVFGADLTRLFAAIYPPFKAELAVAANFMKVYSAVAAVSGARCVVDSSKMTHQFLMLKVAYPGQVKLLALYRDGRAVSKSIIRGERIKFFMRGRFSTDPVRAHREAAKYWIGSVMQMMAVYMRLPGADKYLLRYEDFCVNPQHHVRELLGRFGLSDGAVELRPTDKVCHNIGGSPSRFSFRATGIDLDDVWRETWTADDQKHFGWRGAIVNKLLGYN